MNKLNKKPLAVKSLETYMCSCIECNCSGCICHCNNSYLYNDLDSASKYTISRDDHGASSYGVAAGPLIFK